MGVLLEKLGLPALPGGPPAAAKTSLPPPPELSRRLSAVVAQAALAAAAGGKSGDEIKQRVADATALVAAAAGGDKAAVAKAERAIDVVQMVVETAAAKKYVPSPEAVKFTKHVKATLAKIVALEAKKVPQARALKQSAVAAAKLGQSSKTRAAATAQLEELDREIVQLSAEGEKAAKAGAGAAAAKEQLFTMKVGGRQLTDVTKEQACVELGKALGRMEGELQNAFEAHCEELKIQREEPFAAWVSSGISSLKATMKGEKAVDINDLNIWDGARDMVIKARTALKRQDVEGVSRLLPEIGKATRKGAATIKKYNTDSIESAETAVEIARKTEDVAAEVIAKGAEKYGGEKAGVAAKAGAKSVFQLVEQLSGKYIAGTQKELDWTAVAKEGAASVASDLVGMMLKGAMAERFSKMFGPYLSKANFSEKELEEMAKLVNVPPPINRDFLMTKLQRYVKDFILDKANGLVTDAVSDLIKGKKASEPDMSLEELMESTVKKVVEGKFSEMFVEFVVHHAKK